MQKIFFFLIDLEMYFILRSSMLITIILIIIIHFVQN